MASEDSDGDQVMSDHREHAANPGHRLAEAAGRATQAMQRLNKALRPEIHRRLKKLETQERWEAFGEVLDLFAREGLPVGGQKERMTHWLAYLEGVQRGHQERGA